MNTAITIYNRKTHLFEVIIDGCVIAAGDTYTSAYEAKQSALIRLRVILILLIVLTLTPPAAPAAAKTPNGKKPKGTKRQPKPACLCPKCMGWAGDLDAAVHRCSLLGMHCVYFAGEYRTAHNTELEATIALNQLKHSHLRQAA